MAKRKPKRTRRRGAPKEREPDVTITIQLYTDRDATAMFEGPVDGKWIARARRTLHREYARYKLSHLRDARERKLAERAKRQEEHDRVVEPDAKPVLVLDEEM